MRARVDDRGPRDDGVCVRDISRLQDTLDRCVKLHSGDSCSKGNAHTSCRWVKEEATRRALPPSGVPADCSGSFPLHIVVEFHTRATTWRCHNRRVAGASFRNKPSHFLPFRSLRTVQLVGQRSLTKVRQKTTYTERETKNAFQATVLCPI